MAGLRGLSARLAWRAGPEGGNIPAVISGAVQITPSSIRYSALAPGGGHLTAGVRELDTTRGDFGEVEAAVVEGIEAVRDAGADRVTLFASGELRGARVADRLSVRSRRLGFGDIRFTGTGATIAAGFIARSRTALGESSIPDRETCGVLGIGHHSVGLAVGTVGEGPAWIGSRPVGVRTLAERSRLSDPPEPNQVEAARSAVERSLGGLTNPDFAHLIVVSDFSLATRLVCGDRVDRDSLRLALDSIVGMTSDELGERVGLGSVLAPLFPLALVVQYGAARAFGVDLIPLDPDPARLELALAVAGDAGG